MFYYMATGVCQKTFNHQCFYSIRLEIESYQIMQALIFAVEEINKNPDLLPNITLGFQIYDTCTVFRRAAEGTLWMLSGEESSVPNYRCGEGGTLAGIVGDSASTRSILMAQILGLYRYPQISYFATSPFLSNRNLFPSFFRTVPSDTFQYRGLAELILYFGWTWVGLLATDNDYGQPGIQVIKQEIVRAGACVAFIENIMTGQTNRGAPRIINVIKASSSAKVILVLSSAFDFMPVVEELAKQNITGKIWIASESWSTSPLLNKENFQPVLMGTVGFALHGGQMAGFVEHLNNLHPSKFPNDPFLLEFWEETFFCKWIDRHTRSESMRNQTIKECIGNENIESAKANVDLRITFNVYIAVYAFVWAIQNLLQCEPGKGPFLNGTCANISFSQPWQLQQMSKHGFTQACTVFKDGRELLYTCAVNECECVKSTAGCRIPGGNISGYLGQFGDLVIGGTFPIHVKRIYSETHFTSKPEDLKCQQLEIESYQIMQALIFAVEEINKNPDLLPNITLGFQIYDTCTVLRRAAEGTLWMLSGEESSVPNYRCGEGGTLAGIVGDSASTRSILMAQILGLYRYPQISYFATSPFLSNRNLFPSFFRTVPSDTFQYRGLAELILYFGWTWVGLLATDNDYGQPGIQVIKQEIVRAGACVAFIENIMTGQTNRGAPRIINVIKASSSAKVILVLSSAFDFMPVVEELAKQNITGKIWIASESWSTSPLLNKENFQPVLMGTVGFALHGGQMAGFVEHLNNLHPSKFPNDPFLLEFWEETFFCKWIDRHTRSESMRNQTIKECIGNENIESAKANVDLRITFNVYIAVYAFVWAIQNLLQCEPGKGPFLNGTCANISFSQPWQLQQMSKHGFTQACTVFKDGRELLHYIKTVNFETKDKAHIFFDNKGDSPALYDILNWQLSATGSIKQKIVGSYDSSSPEGIQMKINNAAIVWGSEDPQSKCSPSCPLGSRKVTIPGKPTCCFQCTQCPIGEIANETDAVECQKCSWDTWPNTQQDMCLRRTIEFLSYDEAMGINLAALSIASSLIPIGVLGVFIRYNTTPIVRANNWSLSCLLLIALFFCFLSSLAFIGYPHPEKCLLRQVAFGLAFTLCISCVLAKTITVVIAFKATKPGTSLRRWTGGKASYTLIVICLLIQTSVCVAWLSYSPPFPAYDTQTASRVIILYCNEGSPFVFWVMLGYLGFLAAISFIVAFLARRLPDSFNEAKYITFSMLAFLCVWISFIPAYLSSRGKYTVAMEIFAILSSSLAVVVCIFLPKCFIILFQPHLNVRQNLMRKEISHHQDIRVQSLT
ncbi:vomeronasal type-2 receptor 1-like [Anomaloglossus baeobatrachus]|uniref:vomeronasal type-2 receptor 1-like n=1 Tax=Anomaloglossus baeobatrachus TaxID=238106 RepID=UPI003F50D122